MVRSDRRSQIFKVPSSKPQVTMYLSEIILYKHKNTLINLIQQFKQISITLPNSGELVATRNLLDTVTRLCLPNSKNIKIESSSKYRKFYKSRIKPDPFRLQMIGIYKADCNQSIQIMEYIRLEGKFGCAIIQYDGI